MKLKDLKKNISHQLKTAGIEEFLHSEGYVDYETAALLFDWRFNEPCETYFHNVDDYEGYPEESPEWYEWMCREDNWEACMHNYFINYPDNFVIRYRYARPSYIQVLEWFEKAHNFKYRIDADGFIITTTKRTTVKCKEYNDYIELAKDMMDASIDIIQRFGISNN